LEGEEGVGGSTAVGLTDRDEPGDADDGDGTLLDADDIDKDVGVGVGGLKMSTLARALASGFGGGLLGGAKDRNNNSNSASRDRSSGALASATIPDRVRRQRSVRTSRIRNSSAASRESNDRDIGSYSDLSGTPPPPPPPTELHRLCGEPDVAPEELEGALAANPGTAASSLDPTTGRLPLHVLGDDDVLVSSPRGTENGRRLSPCGS